MKTLLATLAAVGCLASTVAITTIPAEADVVTKVVRSHHGPMGHGCRTVRTIHGGGRVVIRKVCR